MRGGGRGGCSVRIFRILGTVHTRQVTLSDADNSDAFSRCGYQFIVYHWRCRSNKYICAKRRFINFLPFYRNCSLDVADEIRSRMTRDIPEDVYRDIGVYRFIVVAVLRHCVHCERKFPNCAKETRDCERGKIIGVQITGRHSSALSN